MIIKGSLLGGEAFKDGIAYYGLNYNVKGSHQGKEIIHIISETRRSQNPLSKKPFIRGLVTAKGLSLLFLFSVIHPYTMIFSLILILGIFLFGVSRENHGAEHMAVNSYLNDIDLTDIEQVKKSSIVCRRCGSAQLIIFMLFTIAVSFVIWKVTLPKIPFIALMAIVLPAITYEIHISKSDTVIIKLIYKFVLSIQRLVVQYPSDEIVKLASTTLIKLIETEKMYQQEGSI